MISREFAPVLKIVKVLAVMLGVVSHPVHSAAASNWIPEKLDWSAFTGIRPTGSDGMFSLENDGMTSLTLKLLAKDFGSLGPKGEIIINLSLDNIYKSAIVRIGEDQRLREFVKRVYKSTGPELHNSFLCCFSLVGGSGWAARAREQLAGLLMNPVGERVAKALVILQMLNNATLAPFHLGGGEIEFVELGGCHSSCVRLDDAFKYELLLSLRPTELANFLFVRPPALGGPSPDRPKAPWKDPSAKIVHELLHIIDISVGVVPIFPVKYACLLALFDNVDWLYRVMPFLDPNVLTAVSTKVQESSELLVALRDVGPSWRRGGDVPLLSASRIYSFLDKNKAILGIDRFLIGLDEQLNTDVVRIKLLLTALMVDFFAGNFETAPAPVRELLVIFGGIPIRTSDGSTYLVYSEESEPAYLRANGGGCRLCLSEDAFVTRFFPNHRCQAYAAISQAVTQGGHGFPGKHPWTSLATRELPPDLLRIVPRELQSLPLWMASTRPGPLRYRGLQWIFRELRYVDDIPMNLQRAAELGDCLKDASLLSVEALTLLERFDPDGIHGKLQIWLDRSNSTSEIGAIVDFAERRRMSLTCPNLNPLIEESFDADKWGLLRQWWQLVKRYKLPGDLTQFLCDRITKLTLHQVKSVLESELVANKMAVVQAGILRGASLNVLVPLARSLSFNEYREIVRSSVKNKRFDLAIELWTLDLGLHEELLECLAFAKSSKDPYIAEAVPALEFMAASYGLAVSGSESNRSA